MKALVFVLIAVSFTSVCLAQTCGIHEWEADLEFSNTWEYLVHDMLEDKTNPDHWKDKEADYYINAGLGHLEAQLLSTQLLHRGMHLTGKVQIIVPFVAGALQLVSQIRRMDRMLLPSSLCICQQVMFSEEHIIWIMNGDQS